MQYSVSVREDTEFTNVVHYVADKFGMVVSDAAIITNSLFGEFNARIYFHVPLQLAPALILSKVLVSTVSGIGILNGACLWLFTIDRAGNVFLKHGGDLRLIHRDRVGAF